MKKFSLHMLFIMLYDTASMIAAGLLSLLVCSDFKIRTIPLQDWNGWLRILPLQIVLTLVLFWFCRMYHYVWHSIGAQDMVCIVLSAMGTQLIWIFLSLLLGDRRMHNVRFVEFLLLLFLFTAGRCVLRLKNTAANMIRYRNGEFEERIMLIGAGEAGLVLAHELLSTKRLSAKVCCVIDDDTTKQGKFLEGIPIVGGRDLIPFYAEKMKITQIILAIPTASAQTKKEILEICDHTGCQVKSLPGLYQLVGGEVHLAAVKDVRVEDLLGREPISLDINELEIFLRDKTVLVTGGGGSIGSELCRQIAHYQPKKLVILDIYENNAYDIQQELKRKYGDTLDLCVEIASVRDNRRIDSIFEQYRPDIIFHAAAHKHVPLMEDCPEEAIKNNIFGTCNVMGAAEKYGARKFVMISTDKAANPTSIMGATKRFCEMILQSRKESKTEYCAVRFGNVLESNGSVVPLFKKQILEGGPVTVTDKRITRFFMTIPEAVQLVMKAGAMAKQNQIFVLDMGKPVKILTLAENLIRLSGLEPYCDIDIVEIGLRPGEKLFEEFLLEDEHLLKTADEKIYIEEEREISPQEILRDLGQLEDALNKRVSGEVLIGLMKTLIPTYHSPDEINVPKETESEKDS